MARLHSSDSIGNHQLNSPPPFTIPLSVLNRLLLSDDECSKTNNHPSDLFHIEKAKSVANAINKSISRGSAIAVSGDMLDASNIDELVKKSAEFGQGKVRHICHAAIPFHLLSVKFFGDPLCLLPAAL